MSLPDLLLGTRRLHREIKGQSQQLKHDIEQVKFTTAQLRHTTVARVTSPLGLLSAAGVGFLIGKKVTARPSHPKQHPHQEEQSPPNHTLNHIAALVLDTTRSLGIQILLPMAITWAQTKFDDYTSASNKKGKTSANGEGKIDGDTTA